MADIIPFAGSRQRLDDLATLRSGRAYCGPCWDSEQFMSILVPHRNYGEGDDVRLHCYQCGEEYEQ